MKNNSFDILVNDFSIFSKFKRNRIVDLSSSKRQLVLKSIKEKGVLSPITVDSKFRVIDGQHRLEICKLLKEKENLQISLPIVIRENGKVDDIAVINSTGQNWKTEDYIDSFIEESEYYRKLKTLAQKYDKLRDISTIAGLLIGNLNNETTRNTSFQHGEYTFKDESYMVVELYLKFIVQFEKNIKEVKTTFSKLSEKVLIALFKIWTLYVCDEQRLLIKAVTIYTKISETATKSRVNIEQAILEGYNANKQKDKIEYSRGKLVAFQKNLSTNGKIEVIQIIGNNKSKYTSLKYLIFMYTIQKTNVEAK